MKKYAKILSLITASVIALAGCGSSGDQEAGAGKAEEKTHIKVGVTAGPHEQIVEKVKEVAKEKEGLDIEIVVFNDYVLPNRTLHEGEIDANSFQTIPFLENFNADHGANVVVLDKTVTFPMGIYSAKYKSIDEIPDGATVGIQNDPTQRARALFLYEQAGLIKLKADVKDPTPFDIAENPKNLEFKLEFDSNTLQLWITVLVLHGMRAVFCG
ncbi:MetQ/NlpA family ABC transporter substrate-binding protein [Ammoniphilus sp. 3BR4]|uniref:MetQ/NlpA family ABC transporter substrate-binding protein n=1 Tax=Ammoniphilus sp. 3BR4 TaxID=3158265 RepID=UPI0034675E6B